MKEPRELKGIVKVKIARTVKERAFIESFCLRLRAFCENEGIDDMNKLFVVGRAEISDSPPRCPVKGEYLARVNIEDFKAARFRESEAPRVSVKAS